MIEVQRAARADIAFWRSLDVHIREDELLLKIRDGRAYIISAEDTSIGVMRYNLFWDMIPFLTLIHFEEPYRGKGFGKEAMLFWEKEMQQLGHRMVMTSTQVNEAAQHFYRKLGYQDRGSLFLDGTPYEQPQELIMIKTLSSYDT